MLIRERTMTDSKKTIVHVEDTGAGIIVSDPLRNLDKDELDEDIRILKERLKGKFSSELCEE